MLKRELDVTRGNATLREAFSKIVKKEKPDNDLSHAKMIEKYFQNKVIHYLYAII
jgi:hypothetical protein